MTLTAKQGDVFDFICDYQFRRCKPPTVREMMEHFGWSSPNAVASHLAALEAKGYIRRHPAGESRNVEILNRQTTGVAGP